MTKAKDKKQVDRKAKVSEEKNFVKTSPFKWTPERSNAAVLLAQGYTQREVAEEIGVSIRTIQLWVAEIDFSAEVDRLSLMVGIASRAERLRLAMRVIRQKEHGGTLETEKDLLDWLKFAQGETDGIKLDLNTIAASITETTSPVADS